MRKIARLLTEIASFIVRIIFGNIEKFHNYTGVSDEELRSFLERRGLSDLLFYRMYEVDDNGTGIYTMDDGSKGLIMRFYPPPYGGDDLEKKLSIFYETNFPQGTSVGISAFPSKNIEPIVAEYERMHPCEVNVAHKDVLLKIIKNRAKHIRRGAKKSIYKNIDVRIRDFINLISIKFPPGTPLSVITSFSGRIQDTFSDFGIRQFGGGELISMILEMLNPELDGWDCIFDKNTVMNHQMVGPDTSVELNNKTKSFKLGDKWVGKTITNKSYPDFITLFEMQKLFMDPFGNDNHRLPSPFFLNLTVVYDNIDEYTEEVYESAVNNIEQLEMLGKYAYTKPELKARLEEAKEVADNVTNRGEFPLSSMWSITIFEENEDKLTRAVENVKQAFKTQNWTLKEESFATISFQAFIFSLPLQYKEVIRKHLKRFTGLFKSNDASICPLIADDKGFGGPRMIYVSPSGQIMQYDPFAGQSYNAIVTAKTGSGKSFMIADQIVHFLASNMKTVVVDLGRSYQRFNKLIGGQVLEFNGKNDPCLNFFTKAVTKTDEFGNVIKDHHGREALDDDELSTMIPMIGMMMGVSLRFIPKDGSDANSDTLRSYQSSIVEQCITNAFYKHQRGTGMHEVWEEMKIIHGVYLKQKNMELGNILEQMITSLTAYGDKNGRCYKYFNGTNNVNFENDFILLELDELIKKGELFYVVYMALANQTAVEFYYDRSRRKAFLNDEAWSVLDNPIVVLFLKDLYRRIRKYRGMAVLITNKLTEFQASHDLQGMFENTEYKILLKQDRDALKAAYDNNLLAINEFEYEIIKNLKKTNYYSEFVIRTNDGMLKSRVFVDPLSRYLFANGDGHDAQNVEKVSQLLNITDLEAIALLAAKEENPHADTDTLLKALNIKPLTALEGTNVA